MKQVLQNLGKYPINAERVEIWYYRGVVVVTKLGQLGKSINLLGTFAQLERDLVIIRLSEGQVAAKAKGVKFSRPSVLTGAQQKEARGLYSKGASVSARARKYSTSRTTIQRLLKNGSDTAG